MSSSTGVRETNSDARRIIKGLILNEAQFIQSLRIFANTSTLSALGSTGGDSNNSPLEASGNYLAKAGDTMIGPIAFFPVFTEIVSGIINISDVTDFHSSNVVTGTEGVGSTDDLDRIDGARFAGQLLFLQGTIGEVITINNDPSGTGTGGFNIRTPDGNPFTLTGNQNIILKFDSITNQWVIIAGAGGGGSNVPDGSAVRDHLEWNGSVWVAQQNLDFDNNTEAIRLRDFADSSFITVKSTLGNNLQIQRGDLGAVGLELFSNSLTTPETFTMRQLNSGDGTMILATTGDVMRFDVDSVKRLELDTTIRNEFTLVSTSGITEQSVFNVTSTHVSEPDNTISLLIGSGASGVGQIESTTPFLNLIAGGASRLSINASVGTEITQTAFSINPVYDLFRDDTTNDDDIITRINFSANNSTATKTIFSSIFVEANDVTAGTEDSTMFLPIMENGLLTNKLFIEPDGIRVTTGSIRLDEISLPANPPANQGLIYLKDVAGITTPFFLDSAGTETSLIGGGGATELDDLTDVTILTPTNGQTLIYDGVAGLFKNQNHQGLDTDSFKISNQSTTGQTFNENTWHDMSVTSKFNSDTFEIQLSAGDIYWLPLILTLPTTIDGLAYYMETATAGDRTTIGIYDNKGSGLLQPENLIFSFVQTVSTSARLNIFSFTGQNLEPGIYWIALKSTTAIAGINRYRAIPHSQLRPILGYGDNDDGVGATFLGAGIGYIAVADAGNTLPNTASSASNFSKLESGGGSSETSDIVPAAFVRMTNYSQ